MGRFESRLATSTDVSTLYDLLYEYVIEQDLGEEFTNSQQNFINHFNLGHFSALLTEVVDETECKREVIGCTFLSFLYNYIVGRRSFIHCCYVKPAFRDHGLQHELIKLARKVSVDKGTRASVMTVCGKDGTFESALEAEGAINMTTMPSSPSNYWEMQNHSTTPEFSDDDYVIREGTPEDLNDVYALCEKLIEFEKVEEFVSLTKEEFVSDGGVDEALYGTVILEHRRRVDDHEDIVIHDIIGCVQYSKMYHALKGNTYYLQGLYIEPGHKGKGLGKALVQAALQICKDRNGDGFIFMIMTENIVSQSLFKSLKGINMTQSKHNVTTYLLR
eukprot:XP_001183724.2 PREDICTED: uncharacterized protein LOC753912 [Strongylocentrotus purpuratus]